MTALACCCGAVRLDVHRNPIASVECCCTSCRTAAARPEALPGAAPILTEHATTQFVLVRKDRVDIVAGAERLATFRLAPDASTRRVVATCCNAPVWLDVKGGHWLSLYGGFWPEGRLPPLEMRTMAKDLADGVALPDDVPNAKAQSLGFMARLFGAWAAMGFRNPRIEVEETLHA